MRGKAPPSVDSILYGSFKSSRRNCSVSADDSLPADWQYSEFDFMVFDALQSVCKQKQQIHEAFASDISRQEIAGLGNTQAVAASLERMSKTTDPIVARRKLPGDRSFRYWPL